MSGSTSNRWVGCFSSTVFGMPTSCVKGHGLSFWLQFQFQHSEYAHSGRQQVMARVVGVPGPEWEAQTEFQSPGFSLTHPCCCCGHFGSEPADERPLPNIFLILNKQKKPHEWRTCTAHNCCWFCLRLSTQFCLLRVTFSCNLKAVLFYHYILFGKKKWSLFLKCFHFTKACCTCCIFLPVDSLDPEKLLQCPYDKNHQIRACRFPYHLIKCRKVSVVFINLPSSALLTTFQKPHFINIKWF